MMNKLSRRVRIAVAAAALLLVLVCVLTAVFGRRGSADDTNPEIQNSLNYLEALEASGPSAVIEAIQAEKQESLRRQVDDILASIESGDADIWSYFSDAVIIGDSRADDFEYNGFLPRSRILAKMGAMCTDAEEFLDAALDVYPSQIYFTFGMNDVDGSWDTLEEFIDAYRRMIRMYMDEFPYASIFVSSIIPVNQHAIDNDSNYLKIPEYNEAMKQMTAELGLGWIDCDHMLDGREDLYDDDGQHFFPEAYPLWAKLMLKEYFEYDAGLTGEKEVQASEELTSADDTTFTDDES